MSRLIATTSFANFASFSQNRDSVKSSLSDTQKEDLRAWLRLRLTLGVGGESAHALLRTFGLPQQIFAAPLAALRQVVSEKKALQLQQAPENFEHHWQCLQKWLMQSPANQAIPINHPDYPSALLALDDAPVMLYVSGNMPLEKLQTTPSIAIVGSRHPTPQGLINAHQFAKHLSAHGLCVVSGLAIGIDAAAHQGAVKEAAGTIAVVGTGLDRVYPRQNHALAHQIADRGLLISEFELGTPPLANHFPRRNRLIASLSQGCLVVEATLQSGSLITARIANEQGKEVFAIPGSIHLPQVKGCHQLIKQGAKLVENAQDIYDELPATCQAAPHTVPHATPKNTNENTTENTTEVDTHLAVTAAENTNLANPAHQTDQNHNPALLQAMGFDPVAIDSLQARTGMEMATLQSALLVLELQNQIARMPGGLVQRICTL